ncbi:oxidoreductase [Streptomyces sp. S07_1.15]|uniref:oxidoreductase n=1 Tax=Streptomyces sp. S07_1.15 TaxID=2873925 RepID=UPI001D1483E2|nr:oxidoreductase [Streptomyces sp. S07_1.15]MCC3653700.1 oxidoreductase [Streptomyces sp. S07_1.15]
MLPYEELTAPERYLWDAFPEGRTVDLRPRRHGDGPDGAVAGARADEGDGAEAGDGDEPWGPGRTVRASVLAALLLGGHPGQPGSVPALRLAGARISGRLDLGGAEIAHRIRFEECRFEEDISFHGASTRTITIAHSRLRGIDAAMARVEGRFDLRGSTLRGRLSLMNAQVTGELILSGARLSAPGDWALFAGGLVMGGAVFCRGGFTADGGLRLLGAQLSGGLFMEKAQCRNPGDAALLADNATIATLVCSQGFTARGAVRLRGATISGQLTLDGAVLGGGDTALDCARMHADDLVLTPAVPPSGAVDLRGARVTALHDHRDAWPDTVRLQGFVYGDLHGDDDAGREAVGHRLAWIRREPAYAPQPYEQLAGWYRQIGHDDDTRRVLLAKQRHRRRTLRPAGRAWGYLLDGTVGYGYRPWLAGVWLAALALLGTGVFGAHTPVAAQPGEGAPFSALVYTLDLLIPIGGLGQRNAWYWTGGAPAWLAYALIAAGWVLTTAVVAGVTRTLNKT